MSCLSEFTVAEFLHSAEDSDADKATTCQPLMSRTHVCSVSAHNRIKRWSQQLHKYVCIKSRIFCGRDCSYNHVGWNSVDLLLPDGIPSSIRNTSLDLWTTTTTIVTKSMITITMGLNQNSLTSTDQPSATMSRMGPGTTNNSKNSGGAPVGAFVGAAIAAAIFLCVILASIYHCRRRRSKVRTVFPLVHDETYIPLSMGPNAYPSHSGGGDRLEQLRSKKAAAQRHHDRLRSDLERNHKTRNKQRRGSSSGARSEAANLRHQVQVLSARISELEAQQRELELFGGSSPPPPNYTPIALEPFQNLH